MNTPNQDSSTSRGARRNWVSRALVPERKTGHPLWQWILVIVARILAVPLMMFLLLTGIGIVQSMTGTGSLGDFNLMGFNRTDFYISSFYVDGGWGGNLFPKTVSAGGGSATCCTSIPRGSKTLHVRWVLGWKTDEEFRKRAPQETYEADVPIPPIPEGKHSGYVQIYFFSGNRIGAAYDPLPGETDIQPQVTGTRVADTPYNG